MVETWEDTGAEGRDMAVGGREILENEVEEGGFSESEEGINNGYREGTEEGGGPREEEGVA